MDAHVIQLTPEDLRLRKPAALLEFYEAATEDEHYLINALDTMHLQVKDVAHRRPLWRDPQAACYARFLLADMPMLPVLLTARSEAALWVLLSQQDHGISIESEQTTRIHLPTYNAFFDRLEARMEPTKARMGLSPQQIIEIDGQLLNLRHRLLESVQSH